MTRREWCAALAKLVSPSFPTDAQRALLDMLPAMQHLPDDMFTGPSLLAVASAKRRQSVPAWDEIVGALREHRNPYGVVLQGRPALPAPVEPERQPPTPEQIAEVRNLVQAWKAEASRDDETRQVALEQRPKFRDVTLKGEALHRSRQARGCNVPVPGYTPPEVERR